MNQEASEYVCRCGFCEQGLLRLRRCGECQSVAAICDECELLWQDIASVSAEPKRASDGAFPACPACGKTAPDWPQLTSQEITSGNYTELISGRSV